MRKTSIVLKTGALLLAFSGFAAAQNLPPQTSPVNQNSSSSNPANSSAVNSSPSPAPTAASVAPTPTILQNSAMQVDQPASLGDVARLARAKKSVQAKAVRIFDDENMPHAPISAGEKAPEIQGGNGSSFSSGKITILDFWATWCGPCRHALPGLKQLQAIYGGNNVEVVSISEDEDEDAWRSFVAQNQMNWTQRLDSDHQIMRQYGASSLPTYVLIGKDGNIVQQYVGDAIDEPIIERMGPDLKKALEGKS
jgi:thiol-disulfide isomerase/thioredoxin